MEEEAAEEVEADVPVLLFADNTYIPAEDEKYGELELLVLGEEEAVT